MDNLHFLINNLSKGEKKKVSFALNSGTTKESNQQSLYKAYCGSKNPESIIDEGLFERVKNLPATRNQLFETILSVLAQDQGSFDAYYHSEVNKIYFLISRKLYKVALKRTKRIIEKTLDFERGSYFMELHYLEVKLMMLLNMNDELEKTIEQRKSIALDLIDDQKILVNQHSKYYKLRSKYLVHGASRSSQMQEFYLKLLDEINQGVFAKYLGNAVNYYNLMAGITASFALNDFKKALSFTTKLVEIFESNPHEKESDLIQYSGVLYNHLVLLVMLERFDEFDEYIYLLRNLNTSNPIEEIAVKEKYFNLVFLRLIEAKDFTQIDQYIAEFRVFYEKRFDKVSDLYKPLLLGQLVSIHMNLSDFKSALKWNNIFFDIDNFKTIRKDLVFAAELFEIIIHFELKNYDLLHYKINSFRGKLQKKKNRHKIEEILIKHLSKLINQSDEEMKVTLKTISHEIDEVSDNTFEVDLLKKFDLVTYFKQKSIGN
jgi:pterin-4a-carbinolamine dehydratase